MTNTKNELTNWMYDHIRLTLLPINLPSLQSSLQLICTWATLFLSPLAFSQSSQPSQHLKLKPLVDSRGFIDVWQLRRDVSVVESLIATDDTDSCYPEEDPDGQPLSKKEIKSVEQSTSACTANVERKIGCIVALLKHSTKPGFLFC